MLNAREIPQTSSYKRYPPIEPGAYPARVVMVVNLGIQKQRPFKGEERPPQLELLVTYELLDEFLTDDDGNEDLEKPRWVTERFPFYSLESERATSTKRYYALDPGEDKGGNWELMINTPCMVNIVNTTNEKTKVVYDKISNISAMRPREALKAPDLVNQPVTFDAYSPVLEDLQRLPRWIRRLLTEAIDYEGSELEGMMALVKDDDQVERDVDLDDEIPFDSPAKAEKPARKSRVIKIDDEENW